MVENMWRGAHTRMYQLQNIPLHNKEEKLLLQVPSLRITATEARHLDLRDFNLCSVSFRKLHLKINRHRPILISKYYCYITVNPSCCCKIENRNIFIKFKIVSFCFNGQEFYIFISK